MLVREGDDGDVGDAFAGVPAGDGEADAVYGDGAFFGDVAAQILRDADEEAPVVAFGCEAGDAADSVDVTLNEMAAETGGGGERALEIYGLAGLFFAEGCAAKSFAGEIGCERVGVEFDDGETAAADCDAVAEFCFGCDGRSAFEADAQAATFFVVLKLLNFSDVLGDSRKHRESILGRRNLGRSD